MTAKLPGLQKHQRTGMYWIRRVVPPDLRDIIGRREITRTLETKDPREAKRRYPAVAAIIEEIFDQARAQLASAQTHSPDSPVIAAPRRASRSLFGSRIRSRQPELNLLNAPVH